MKKIEQASSVDLPEILQLQKKAFAEVAKRMNREELPPLLQSIEDIRKEWQQTIILKYTSEDNKIIGSVRGYVDENNICHIGKLIVDPDFQNQGIGKILMYEIENYFPSCKKFHLFTGVETPNTVHLYRKVGYTIIEKQKIEGVSMIIMEKKNENSI